MADGEFVASRTTTAPTHCYSYGSGRPDQRLVAASLLLLLLLVVAVVAIATAWGLGPCAGHGALPLCHLGGWGVPGAAFRSPGTLVRQVVIPYPVPKCNHYRSIGDTRNGIANLREPLDEGAQGFPSRCWMAWRLVSLPG
jgi:hypothetical protein